MFSENPRYDLEVNHIKAGHQYKKLNTLENLEYSTRKENAHHAAINHLYKTCEEHHKSLFTNEQIHQICSYLSQGMPMCDIIKLMNMKDVKHIKTYISRIKNRQTWNDISCKYIWSDDVIFKTYSKTDIELMCEYIFIHNCKLSKIINEFPQYNSKKLKQVLKKIKQKKLYRSISKQYWDKDESSTTNENDDYYNIIIN